MKYTFNNNRKYGKNFIGHNQTSMHKMNIGVFMILFQRLATPRSDEWSRLQRTLYDLQSSQSSKQTVDTAPPLSRHLSPLKVAH